MKILLFALILITSNLSFAENWQRYFNDSISKLYYDRESISIKPGSLIVDLLRNNDEPIKITNMDGFGEVYNSSIMKVEIYCGAGTIRTIQFDAWSGSWGEGRILYTDGPKSFKRRVSDSVYDSAIYKKLERLCN